jgi:hypothetical protein
MLALKIWWLGVVMRRASTVSHVAWLVSDHYEGVAKRAASQRMVARQDSDWRPR